MSTSSDTDEFEPYDFNVSSPLYPLNCKSQILAEMIPMRSGIHFGFKRERATLSPLIKGIMYMALFRHAYWDSLKLAAVLVFVIRGETIIDIMAQPCISWI